MKVGTSHFVSVRAANAYYAAQGFSDYDVMRKIVGKEIFIGEPTLKPGETLTIIDNDTGQPWGGRYAIVTEEN